MYKKIHFHQTTFYDFNQSCGMELSSENEWCRLGDRIAWNELEETYSQNFPGHTGRPAFSVRMALGALIIQKRMRLSDRALVKAIAEKSVLSILYRFAEVYAEISVHGSGIGFIPETSHCGCAGEIQ